jgi:arylsulfatase
VVPTIYEAVGVSPPDVYRGYDQLPIAGTSMVPSWTAAPDAPSAKPVQYFEMMGHRGIWQDGWKAVTRHAPGTPFDEDHWELYHVDVDRSECHDLAAAEPERLAALVDLWWEQAAEHGVLPLDDRGIELFGARFRDGSPHRADRHYTYRPPMSSMPAQVGPQIGGRSWDLDARIERDAGDNGVLYATGTGNSGVAVFLQGEHLVLDYNEFGTHHVVESDRAVPVGASTVGVRFRRTGGTAGRATLVVDGEEAGTLELPFVMNIISSIGPSVGHDHGSPVSDRYDHAFPFAGTLHRVDIQLVSAAAAGAAASAEREAMGRQ